MKIKENSWNVKNDLNSLACQTGYKVLEERGAGLIWMSAGNSYFTEDVIERLLEFANKNLSKIAIMAPNEPAEHTYKALGYKEHEAKRKARLNANLLKNRAKRIIEKMNQQKVDIEIKIIEDISLADGYKESYRSILKLYKTNPLFKADAKEVTQNFLRNKLKEGIILEKAINLGVFYLLKELAFVISSPKIFNSERIAYIYHKEWEIYDKLVSGFYDGLPRANLGFILVKINRT